MLYHRFHSLRRKQRRRTLRMFPNMLLRFRNENSRKKADKSIRIQKDARTDRDLWNHNKEKWLNHTAIEYSNPRDDSINGKGNRRRDKASSFTCIFHPLIGSLKKSCHGGDKDHYSDESEEEEDDKGAAGLVEGIMDEVLGAMSTQSLQDPESAKAVKMEVSMALQRLVVLKQIYKKRSKGMKMESVRAIEEKTEMLRKKLRLAILGTHERKRGCRYGQWTVSPIPELFEATMRQVRDASQSFASLLYFLTRSARWDISAVVRSITAATSDIGTLHTRYALDSHVTHKIFQGFDSETFLINTIHSPHHLLDGFHQYQDMQHSDPIDFLDAFPNGSFSKFCSMKYRSIVHSKMEECFFWRQQRHAVEEKHPMMDFYKEFLGLAKAVWMLHLLSLCLDSAPVLFSATRGDVFHPWFMDSVVSWVGGQVPMNHNLVGFPISPGFKLGNGSVVKARVYLVSRSGK